MGMCGCGCGMIPNEGYRYIIGHHLRGRKLSDGHKKKLSEINRGKKLSDEHKKKIGSSNKGKKRSKETIDKLRKSHTLYKKIRRRCKCGCGQLTKKGRKYVVGHHRIGKTFSETHKERISKSLTGKKLSSEHIKKISNSLCGRKLSERHKRKMSEVMSGTNHPFYGKEHTKDSKLKMSVNSMKCRTDGYCDAWSDNEFKEDLRKDFCETCGMLKEESMSMWKQRLSLHHKDGDKKNCHPDNVGTACRSCHASLDWKLRKESNYGT